MSEDLAPAQGTPARTPVRRKSCRTCNQHHSINEPHLYDYIDDVDEDVSCHICLQPLVTPVDTPCGHTFCKPCLMTYLRMQSQCPVDRRPLTHQLCTPSSHVLRKLLEKLIVRCPNTTKCEITLQRGDLEDHLKYRCPGNWVCCPYSPSGCDVRGPQKTVATHAATCPLKDATGREKPSIAEGEVSHIEIARTQTALGITIVGGADTPLRCVVVQEIFPDGLISQDGRLQSGDQIIEVDGVDMTSATHSHVCQELSKFVQPTLRLGVYREKIHAFPIQGSPSNETGASITSLNGTADYHTVTLWRESGRQLGIKLGGRQSQPGIFILEILAGSVAATDGRLKNQDRILAINGHDVRYARLDVASRLIQRSGTTSVTLVLSHTTQGNYSHLFHQPNSSIEVVHSRTKSAPEPLLDRLDMSTKDFNKSNDDMSDSFNISGIPEDGSRSCESLSNQPDNLGSSCNGTGYSLANYSYKSNGSIGSLSGLETQQYQSNGSLGSIGSPFNKSLTSSTPNSHRISQIESPKNDILSVPSLPPRSRLPLGRAPSNDPLVEETVELEELLESPRNQEDVVDGQVVSRFKPRRSKDSSDLSDLACGFRRALKLDGAQLHQKTVTISKSNNESLGMRIGGGVSSNEGDTPIYIANINPNGPVGKSNNVKKGDVLLSVNGQSLLGLTHGQAVAQLKATAELAGVTLSLLDGPETSASSTANFVPSWLYWQKLPRPLQISRSVVLQRSPGSSLGFSIVGGTDPSRGSEPIHVLLVVASSPAAIDGKLRCGDRILSVDNYSLENVSHSVAVGLLKQAGQRVHLEVVSWLGTEL